MFTKQKLLAYQAYPQIYFNFSITQNHISILYLAYKKHLKHRNDPKNSPVGDGSKQIYTKILIPPKIFTFMKTPKHIKIKNFDPKILAKPMDI